MYTYRVWNVIHLGVIIVPVQVPLLPLLTHTMLGASCDLLCIADGKSNAFRFS